MGVQMFVCMFVCLPVGMSRANGNPNPCTDHDEILQAYSGLSKESFGLGLAPAPSPAGLILKAEGRIFENCLQNKRCPAGCKLTRANFDIIIPGTKKLLMYKVSALNIIKD